jgi:putative ABC transport system permease protein
VNLASKDVWHNRGRFALTTLGVGMLLMIVMSMGGLLRGMTEDATTLLDKIGADLWIVQRGTYGPFAEVSRVPRNLVDRVAAVPGVEYVREFVYHTIQRKRAAQPLRAAVLGLSWPSDRGAWLPLTSGRALAQNHFEMIADEKLGLQIGEQLRLGQDTFTVVGITTGMTDNAGNGMAFLTVRDAVAVQFDVPGEAIRLERGARRARAGQSDLGNTQPSILERAAGAGSQLPALPTAQISAVIARLAPGAQPAAVREAIEGWADVTVYTREDQRQLLLRSVIERASRQLGLFGLLLTIVSGIIMALILYTLTLDKVHDIALLKLIGAPNRTILGLILQQALILGALAYGIAYLLGQQVFPYFPRRVSLTNDDLLMLAGVVVGISVLASVLGIWKALSVEPNTALMG